jgi:serine/threonine protein kinase
MTIHEILNTWPVRLLIWVLVLFIAPESLFRQPYDQCADYYSIGVIAYECCMGRVRLILKKLNVYMAFNL